MKCQTFLIMMSHGKKKRRQYEMSSCLDEELQLCDMVLLKLPSEYFDETMLLRILIIHHLLRNPRSDGLVRLYEYFDELYELLELVCWGSICTKIDDDSGMVSLTGLILLVKMIAPAQMIILLQLQTQ